MKIEYIRNMQFGYMRMELANPLSKTEEAMLENNVIEGILSVRWQQENDKYLLRYDITGKQALDGVLENAPADEKLLKSLLVGIYVAVKQLEKYLLPQEGILLSPETIFFDNKSETMHFCYFPEETEPLQERLTKLLEYILAKTDHKNVFAVQVAYGVYEEVQKPSFCMENLQSYIQEKSAKKYEEQKAVIADESEDERYYPQRILQKEERAICRIPKPDWKEKIMAWIKEKVEKFSKSKRKEAVVFDVEETPVFESATTILSGNPDRIEGVLRYEGTGSLRDIYIMEEQFVIGSASGCDAILCHPNISRNHAKITCRDDAYFIEDLNSTNGTSVDGVLLSYKTKVELRKNVRVCFANEPFRFV